jgi:hypothetical protein
MVPWWQVQSELVPGLSATKSRGVRIGRPRAFWTSTETKVAMVSMDDPGKALVHHGSADP